MKVNGNAVKPGMIVEHKGELWSVTKSQSVKPGKGGAFNQVEMKNIKTNTMIETGEAPLAGLCTLGIDMPKLL